MFTGLVETIGTVIAAERAGAGLRLRVDLGSAADGVRLGDSICPERRLPDGGGHRRPRRPPSTPSPRRWPGRPSAGGRRARGSTSSEACGPATGWAGTSWPGTSTAPAAWWRTASATAAGGCGSRHPRPCCRRSPRKAPSPSTASALRWSTWRARPSSVALIPTTLAATTLGGLGPGDLVNLETDLLAKYVRRALGAAVSAEEADRRLQDALGRGGFIE